MGKKRRSFMDKVAKGTGPRGEICPKCDSVIRYIKVVKATSNEKKNSWRFIESVERVCKCNEKEILA